MSIFIATLAFTDDGLLNAVKLGVLLGSLVSAMLGLGRRLRVVIGTGKRTSQHGVQRSSR
jgi:Na+/H+ antiporter NhaA